MPGNNQVFYRGILIYCLNDGTNPQVLPKMAETDKILYVGTICCPDKGINFKIPPDMVGNNHIPYSETFIFCPNNGIDFQIFLAMMKNNKISYIDTFIYCLGNDPDFKILHSMVKITKFPIMLHPYIV